MNFFSEILDRVFFILTFFAYFVLYNSNGDTREKEICK